MTRLSHRPTAAGTPTSTWPTLFQEMARPWQTDQNFLEAMWRPSFQLFDPVMKQSLDAIFNRFAAVWRMQERLMSGMDLNVDVDVVEKDGAYKVQANLPGVKKEDINVRVDGNVVTIEAHAGDSKENRSAGTNVVRNERFFGAVSRSFTLAQEVDESKASGKYVDGVLTLELPKKALTPKPETRRLEIH